jgi:signal transduction histidine kinase/tetratricopeptide (TPR) repeat protein
LKKLLPLILLLSYCTVTAQKQGQARIDSLIKEIPFAKNDTAAVRLHKLITEEYTVSNPVKAKLYANKGMQLAVNMNWPKAIAIFNSAIATLFSDAGQYDSSVFYNDKALAIHKKNNDSFNIASLLNNMGVTRNRQSKYTEAANYFFESLKVAEQIKNKGLMAYAYNNMADVYSAQKDLPKALDYSFKALKIREEQEDNTDGVADALVSIANTYLQMEDSVKGYSYYQQALPLYQQTDNMIGVATIYTNMSALSNKDYKSKFRYATLAQEIWDVVSPSHPVAVINTGNLGVAYLDIAKEKNSLLPKQDALSNAVLYLKKAIALYRQSNDINGEAFYVGNLAEAQEQTGDYKNAYINFRYYQRIQDSVYSQENKNKIAAIEGQREVAIRDKEISFNKKALTAQRKLRGALIGGIGLLFVVAGMFFYQSKNRKKVNTTLLKLNTELDEANKVKARFFGMISHDLRNPISKLIAFLQVQKNEPGLLTETETAAHQEKLTKQANMLLENMEVMLLWSKGQMQHFKPVIKNIPVGDLFAYIEKNFYSDTALQFHFLNDSKLIISTDENYMQTIMYNLTANAVKALQNTPAPAIEWRAEKNDDKTILTITDNGPGMTNEQVRVLFDDASLINGKKGLGMHIIRDLAKAINCSIAVDSSNTGTQIKLIH